jgi:hypothetical protein
MVNVLGWYSRRSISRMSPARRIGGKVAHQRRGAADCGEYRQTTGVV